MKNIEKVLTPVYVSINGEELKLEYRLHSLAQLYLLTGKSVLKGELDTSNPVEIGLLLWAGLIANKPEWDGAVINGQPSDAIRDAVNLISRSIGIHSLPAYAAAISRAFNVSAPSPGDNQGEQIA
jgi:hypothetical protein